MICPKRKPIIRLRTNPVRPEQGHGQERRKDRCPAAKSVADPRCPQAHFRGEQFRNVNRKERGDQDINGNGQQEADRDQSRRLMDERINAAGHIAARSNAQKPGAGICCFLAEFDQHIVQHGAGDFVAVAGVIQGKGEDVSGVIDHASRGVLASLGLLLLMAGTVYKECKPVKWRGTCLYEMSGPLYLKAQREKEPRRPASECKVATLGHGAKNGRHEETCIRDDSESNSLAEAVTLE